MRCDTPPFDDVHVRQALKYAIDREAIVRTILRGHGTLGNDHPISRSNRYHADNLEQRAVRPGQGQVPTCKQAGMDSLSIDLSAADAAFAGAVDAAVLYKEHAAAAGIDINVVREPDDGYWSNVWMVKPYCAVYWGGSADRGLDVSRPPMRRTRPGTTASGSTTSFNQLLLAARSELDEAKRRGMYEEMQSIVSRRRRRAHPHVRQLRHGVSPTRSGTGRWPPTGRWTASSAPSAGGLYRSESGNRLTAA